MTETLLAAAKEYPVVTLTGPRQAGKTTLVRLLPLSIRELEASGASIEKNELLHKG